jgi:hypothetical protein
MTKRSPVSFEQTVFTNSQMVDDEDLSLEQTHNDVITADIINNHIGTGILPEVLVPNILFNSSLASGFLDGTNVQTQFQPSDNNFGNQLELTLTGSKAGGKRDVKIAIIGLDFQSNLQYETFVFKTNEIQVSKKHFTKILLLLFNDFVGDPDLSFNLGGQLVISEASPMTLSRDPIMVSQDVQPNLFFRDFFVDGFASLQSLLQSALPLYNVDTLNIFTAPVDTLVLPKDDVTTQIGQKFQAVTNNIQKISLLLSVRNTEVGHETDLTWNGELIVSVYPLQSNIECPTDIAPNLQIDFAPANNPIAQTSIDYATLQASGYVLDSIPQPIDFIFSNSPLASGNVLTPGKYYAVTIKRAGSANKCDLLISAGSDQTPNSRITIFTGSLWVDIPEEDLWFRIWTDAAKVSDGQAYESGHGMIVPKTQEDVISQATIDFSKGGIQFTGNDVFRAVATAVTEETTPIPDQRTGQPVFSRKEVIPKIDLLNTIDLTNLEKTTDPLLLGAISDKNRKFFDSISSLIISKLYSATMVNNELLIRVVDDPTDTGRYDTSVIGLISNLLNGDFASAKIIPDASDPSVYYRIASARLCSMILGDVNGDGIIDQSDLDLLNTYIGYDLTTELPLHTSVVTDGYTTTYTNGYITYTNPFSDLFSIHFQLVDPNTHIVVADGYDGVLVANPADSRLAQFTSASVSFSNIIGLSSFKIVLITPTVEADYGGFDIVSLDTVSDVLTIRKIFLTGDVLAQMLRSDVDGDFHITFNDGYLLQNYIDRHTLSNSPVSPFPSPATNPFTKIGVPFNVIRLRVEEFIDRGDDYSPVVSGRSGVVHPLPDIFEGDGYFDSHNFYASPVTFNIQKQLTWDESLIVSNGHTKLVPSVFTTLNGFQQNSCSIEGVHCSTYPASPDFDPGRVDFFVPNNLILGAGGELKRSDDTFYKVDFEVGTIILEIPDGLFGSEKTINLMDDFISDYTGHGVTRLGFPAMRFADCSYVLADALTKDQLRFSVSVQSFSPNTNGLSTDGYGGIIVDGKIGVSIDPTTALLTLNFTNLFQDTILKTLNTKIQVHVFLKKGGFNNVPLFVDSVKVQNLLKLVSVFSGVVDGGPSALVDLANDVSDVLPILHGGTGLDGVGAAGTVLVSTGSGLSYQFILASNASYAPGVPGNWTGSPPTTVQQALDRIAAAIGPIP